MFKNPFIEIRNDFYDEDNNCYCIDAWKTNNQSEEGKVVARVYKDKVEFTHPNYKLHEELKDIIEETQKLFI